MAEKAYGTRIIALKRRSIVKKEYSSYTTMDSILGTLKDGGLHFLH
jgi:hypothetical protein